MTFENCPHGLRNWKREGLGACARLGCALAKGGCTCQRKCVERVAPIFGNGLMTNAFQTCRRISVREHPLYTTCTLNPSHRGARWWWSSPSLT